MKPGTRRPRPHPHQPAGASTGPGRTALAVLAILLGGLLAYANSFGGVLVFDDEPAIVANPHLRRLWPVREAIRAPEGTTVSGRPLVSLTLALNYALAPQGTRDMFALPIRGAAPPDRASLHRNLWGYHALNLAIHLAAALTLFGVLRRTLSGRWLRGSTPGQRAAEAAAPGRGRLEGRNQQASADPAAPARGSRPGAVPGDDARWPGRLGSSAYGLALAMALVWTVHPLQTSAVTYVVQRAESLMGLCLLLTLYCAIRAWGGSRWWLAAAVLSCAAGMGSKETMVVAPLVVLLWDWTFASRVESLKPRAVLYGGLAATWLLLAVLVSGGHRPNAAGFSFTEWPWWRYLLTQAGVIVHYLRLALVPSPLVLDYAWPPARLSGVAPQLAVLIALAGWTAWAIARRRPAAFAAGAFFLILAPTSSVLPIVTEVAAEHRMYLPLAAVLAVMIAGVHRVLQRWRPATATRAGWVLTVAAVTGLGALTAARNADYQDHERLWLDTIQKRPLNARARNNYATLLVEQGRYGEAEVHVRAALQVEPASVEAQQTLGVALCAQSRCDEGLPHLEAASALAPASAEVQRNLAEAYASRGRMTEAVAHYQRALELRPDDVMLLNRAGWILATGADAVRDGGRAVVLAERAVRLTARTDVDSLDTLAAGYAEMGRFDEAVAVAAAARQLAPDRAPAMMPELAHRLALYRTRRPFRQPLPLEIR